MTGGRPRRASASARGLGLAGRLSLQLSAIALLVTAVAGWSAHTLVRRTLERQLSGELDRLRSAVERELGASGEELSADLVALGERLRDRDSVLLEQLLEGAPEAWNVASRLKPVARVDALEILGPGGEIVSSDRGRTGLEDEGLKRLVEGRPTLRRLTVAGREHLALTVRLPLAVGSRELALVGSRVLGKDVLDRVAGADAALLFEASGAPPLASALGERLDRQAVLRSLREQPGDESVWSVGDVEGRRWDARAVPLTGGDGTRLATVVVAVDRDRVDRLLARLRTSLAVVAAAMGLLAALAGLWLARSISRPVRNLVHAFDAIAAGEADYGFPAAGRDELQELVASISRLQRALDIQRERSSAAERVATWRDLARHVAHEVKNPLAPIRLTVENLLRARQQAPDRFDALFRDGARTILEEVDQLRRMVEEFSAFARLPLPSRAPEDLERILDGVLELWASDAGVEIERRYSGNLPRISLDADQISRALKNVVGNAVEASREAGPREASPLELEVRTGMEEGVAVVEIADDGPGFSEEASRRLFEPYFTTKSEGTGLGMALTYRIIVEHGGAISARNRPGGGAVVSIRLPVRAGRESDGASAAGAGETNA
jgi:signal transduction histidine kinase